jgi:hypothetical protein
MDRAVLGQRVVTRRSRSPSRQRHGRDGDPLIVIAFRARGVVDRRLADRQVELGAAVDDGLS